MLSLSGELPYMSIKFASVSSLGKPLYLGLGLGLGLGEWKEWEEESDFIWLLTSNNLSKW